CSVVRARVAVVGGGGGGGAGIGRQSLCELSHEIGAPRSESQQRAMLRKLHGKLLADAGGCSGDENHLAAEASWGAHRHHLRGTLRPRATAGRARKASSARVTLGKSAMPTNSPAP